MAQDIVRETVLGILQAALHQARSKGLLKADPFPALTLDPPKRPEWGDLATTVAMGLASAERRPPHEIAELIVRNMPDKETVFERVEVARPGYVNMTVRRELWLKVLREVEAQGAAYGRSEAATGRRVLVEYVSANPTGPLHVGHGRNAAVGQAVARLLSAVGAEAVNEYYVNDAGRQMQLLGDSVWAHYQRLHGRAVDFPEDGYQGEYLKQVATRLGEESGARLLEAPPGEAVRRCREFAYRELLDDIKSDLKAFRVDMDVWFSERSLISTGSVEQALADLRERKLVFEEDDALWFRSSQYGDEKDRVVRKRDGEYTYLASDIAYHRDKLSRGYDLLVDVWGADHHGYIPRMHAVVQAFGHPKERLRVVLVQMVNLLRGGRKVEMSKRSGEFITLREVIGEVGADAAKFFFLMRRSDTPVDFDLDLAKQQSAENPVYYVQYAHARVSSLCRRAEERGITVPVIAGTDLTLLGQPDELALIKKVSAYPSVVQGSGAALEPHRITFYLQELAALLHTYYYKHRILPVADPDAARDQEFAKEAEVPSARSSEVLTPALTAARLILMRQIQQVIRNGLDLLGIGAPERM